MKNLAMGLAPAFLALMLSPALAEMPTLTNTPACGQLRILNSVQMQTTAARSEMFVPVKIEGQTKSLLLDTGGQVSQISRDTARELRLRQEYSHTRLFDVAGNISSTRATADNFTLGAQDKHHVALQVAPNPTLGRIPAYDGVLATDMFANADIDMDFGAARLTAFASDHCDGRVIYWPADNIAVVPVKLDRGHISLDVTVDGHPLKAVLDTGAQQTSMNISVARNLFGLSPDTPDMPRLDDLQGAPGLKVYSHKFPNLTFEGVEVGNLKVLVLPDQMRSRDPGRFVTRESALALPDIVIGMDVLRHLHIYLARAESKLYVSQAVRGPSALFAYKDKEAKADSGTSSSTQ